MCQVQRLGEVISRRRNSHEIQQLKRVEEIVRYSSESWRARDKELLHNEKKWTVAEGAIYADFDKRVHVIKEPIHDIIEYFAGVDWGYDHYGSIVVIGRDKYGNHYIVDGTAKRYEYIDYWIHQAQKFKEKYGDMPFYCDTARVEHINAFKDAGIKAEYANKSVLAGIEQVAKMWTNNRLYYIDKSIPRFEEEIFNYVWKENSKEDQPREEFDDVLDALRYALYTQHLIDSRSKMDVKQSIKTFKKYF